MHELGKFIQSLMDQEGMTQPELVRRSGLTRQHVHTMLRAEKLSRLPEAKTIDGLHKAFPHVSTDTFVLKAAAAMGIPVAANPEAPDYSKLSNDALLGILKDRLEGGSDGRQPEAQKTPPPHNNGGAVITPLTRRQRRALDDGQPVTQAAYDGNDEDESE